MVLFIYDIATTIVVYKLVVKLVHIMTLIYFASAIQNSYLLPTLVNQTNK